MASSSGNQHNKGKIIKQKSTIPRHVSEYEKLPYEILQMVGTFLVGIDRLNYLLTSPVTYQLRHILKVDSITYIPGQGARIKYLMELFNVETLIWYIPELNNPKDNNELQQWQHQWNEFVHYMPRNIKCLELYDENPSTLKDRIDMSTSNFPQTLEKLCLSKGHWRSTNNPLGSNLSLENILVTDLREFPNLKILHCARNTYTCFKREHMPKLQELILPQNIFFTMETPITQLHPTTPIPFNIQKEYLFNEFRNWLPSSLETLDMHQCVGITSYYNENNYICCTLDADPLLLPNNIKVLGINIKFLYYMDSDAVDVRHMFPSQLQHLLIHDNKNWTSLDRQFILPQLQSLTQSAKFISPLIQINAHTYYITPIKRSFVFEKTDVSFIPLSVINLFFDMYPGQFITVDILPSHLQRVHINGQTNFLNTDIFNKQVEITCSRNNHINVVNNKRIINTIKQLKPFDFLFEFYEKTYL